MGTLTGAGSHPSALNDREQPREGFEREQWDDIDGVVFAFRDTADYTINSTASRDHTLSFGSPTACRIEIQGTYTLKRLGGTATTTTTLILDGTTIFTGVTDTTNVAADADQQITFSDWADVAAGNHTLVVRVTNGATASADITFISFTVRRGRPPAL